MDSANSGSMQSSSGGDEEFHSKGESISFFLNPSPHFSSISTPHQQILTHQNPTFFEPHPSSQNVNLHAFPLSNPTSNQYNDSNNNDHLIWSRDLRSEPNYANFGNLTSPSLLPSRSQSIASQQAPFANPSPSGPPPLADAESHAQPQSTAVKNPKKRTRASRRTPTTVLTTDAANFRQMVQEFTGIPAVPLSGSPYSRRLDLLSAAPGRRTGPHLDNFGPLYPLGASSSSSSHNVISPFSSSLLNSNMTMHAATGNLGGSSSNNANNYSVPSDRFLRQQKHEFAQQVASNNASMNFGGLNAFRSHDEAPFTAAAQNDENFNRWRSGEMVRNRNDGVEDNLMNFDAGRVSVSGYSLNLSGNEVENVGSAGAEGNVASWICPSER